ncbi:MAG: LptF/LptG family permease [Thermoguttaceae bacterium]|nr:LptF/LptG family permease [Thermoguttaceae bacterium]
MKIVDRYVFWKFFRIFVLCYVSLVGVYVVFDLFTNFDDFLKAKAPPVRLITSIAEYYFVNSFVFIDMIFPLLTLLAAMAATSMMARQNEIIALLATGVSPGRMILPILAGAFLVSLSFTAVREEFLPRRLVEINLSPTDFVNRSDVVEVASAFDGWTRVTIDGESLVRSEGKVLEPKILLGRNLNRYGNRLVAKSGVYLDADGERPAGWLLSGAKLSDEARQGPSWVDEASGRTVVYTPGGADWLEPDQAFVATSIDAKRLAAGDRWRLYDSTSALNAAANDPTFARDATELAIRAHSRTLRPLTDLLPLCLGLPFVFLRSDRNIFAALGYGCGLAGAYVASQYVAAYFGEKLGSASVGVWAPFFVFIPLAANMLGELTKKEV